jgi:hypothetical protein
MPLYFSFTIEPMCFRTRSIKDMGIIMDVIMLAPASVFRMPELPGLSVDFSLSEARVGYKVLGLLFLNLVR